MNVELIEIRDFLADYPPFSLLDPAALDTLPKLMAVRYLRRGSAFPPTGEAAALYVIRKGAVEQRSADGKLIDMLGEGDIFDAPCHGALPASSTVPATVASVAVEDTLLYLLPCPALQTLRREQPRLDEFFVRSAAEHLRHARHTLDRQAQQRPDLMAQPVSSFAQRAPVTAAPELSILEASRLMTRERVSALMIVDRDRLAGIVTDRDLRSRCLAEGVSPEEPVARIMTSGVASIGPENAASEALLTMTRHGIHHLPVVDAGGVRGLVSATDLMRWQSANAVHLAGQIRKCASVAALATASAELPELQMRMHAGGANAAQVGQAISSANDAITCRLIELAQQSLATTLGPPPISFAWAACGSQGRHEQTAHSDQDNALILHDDYRPQEHAAWFEALARFVNDGLDACGFRYCPGKVMASTSAWRQNSQAWVATFQSWMRHTDNMGAMLAANFLDLRVVFGDPALLTPLHETVVRECARNEGFLARMAANAVETRPPLGFFRNLLLAGGGDHAHTFDIKRGGLIPITDLARIHALSAGLAEIGTVARLRAAAGHETLSSEAALELEEAFSFLGGLRLRHQAGQIRQGLPPDNFIAPESLTALERTQLKAVFAVIGRLQDVLAQRYPNRTRE
ncbi:MAG: cyclic nucleotide-binding/CBS domain-containing protein [Betaproteobacteria bacterium]|nr:cyclic nucleotide-binding/CBS domain-containing protein [Betaproteobacteria bacterium]